MLEFLPEQFTKVVLVYGANEAYRDGGNAWTEPEHEMYGRLIDSIAHSVSRSER